MPSLKDPPLLTCYHPDCSVQFYPKHRRAKYCSRKCKHRSYAADRQDYFREKAKEYRLSDPEKFRERARQNYQKFRTARLAHGKTAYQTTRHTSPWVTLLYAAKERAKEKSLPFDLTREWAEARWTGRCEITGLSFLVGAQGRGPKPMCATIDRIDPKLGYIQSNCRIILQAVNALKSTMTDAEMVMVAKALIDNFNPQN